MLAVMTTSIDQVSTSAVVDTSEAGKRATRRRWPEALKRRIVGESLAPGASASVLARRYDVNANQLFKWWRQYAAARSNDGPAMVPVAVWPSARRRRAGERSRSIWRAECGCGSAGW